MQAVLRASDGDRELLDRAAAVVGTDRSSFLLNQGRLAAQRVLAANHQLVGCDGQTGSRIMNNTLNSSR